MDSYVDTGGIDIEFGDMELSVEEIGTVGDRTYIRAYDYDADKHFVTAVEGNLDGKTGVDFKKAAQDPAFLEKALNGGNQRIPINADDVADGLTDDLIKKVDPQVKVSAPEVREVQKAPDHGGFKPVEMDINAETGAVSSPKLREAADTLSDVGKKAGTVAGVAAGVLAAGAASASELVDGASLDEAALAGAEVFHETANPFAGSTEAALDGQSAEEVAQIADDELDTVAAEATGGIVGAKFGASLGTMIMPGWGTAVLGTAGAIGGSILGAEAMEAMAENLSAGTIELNPEQALFFSYLEVLPNELPPNAPAGLQEMVSLRDEIGVAEQRLAEVSRTIPIDMQAKMEAENALYGNDEQGGLYAQYEQSFFSMTPEMLEEHAGFFQETSKEQLAEVGLTDEVTLPDGRTMDMVDALKDPEGSQVLREHMQKVGNDEAVAAIDDLAQTESLDQALQTFNDTYAQEQSQPEQVAQADAKAENTNTYSVPSV